MMITASSRDPYKHCTGKRVLPERREALTRGCGRQRFSFVRDDAHRAIREGARQSVGLIGKAKPFVVDLPMELRIQFNETGFTDGPVSRGAERVDPLTIRRVVDSQIEVYRV